jgi:hypothetical protein
VIRAIRVLKLVLPPMRMYSSDSYGIRCNPWANGWSLSLVHAGVSATVRKDLISPSSWQDELVMFQCQPAPEIVLPHLVGLPSLLRSLLRRPTRHSGLLRSASLVLHELMRAGTWLVRVLTHARVSRISSHSVHGLVLLDRRSVHRTTALNVMQLG